MASPRVPEPLFDYFPGDGPLPIRIPAFDAARAMGLNQCLRELLQSVAGRNVA